MKLQWRKKFCTKGGLLIFKITLPSVKLDMVVSRLMSNVLIFAGDIPVDTHLVTFLLLPNTRELRIGVNIKKKFDNHLYL